MVVAMKATSSDVGAEPERRIGALGDAEVIGHVEVGLVRRVSDQMGDQACGERQQQQQDDHDAADHGRLILAETRPENLARAPALDRRRETGGLDCSRDRTHDRLNSRVLQPIGG